MVLCIAVSTPPKIADPTSNKIPNGAKIPVESSKLPSTPAVTSSVATPAVSSAIVAAVSAISFPAVSIDGTPL